MKGLLLVNLGTPDAPDTASVRSYLRELLSDPLVMDIPWLPKRLLLELVILPFRPAQSARAYAGIWTDRGSPLLFHGEDLARALRERLGEQWMVEIAMRYGRPRLDEAVARLVEAGVDEIALLPLYPHDAQSTRGSTIEATTRALARLGERGDLPPLKIVPAFYEDPGFIAAVASSSRPVLDEEKPEYVLFSFHGLPESHIRKADSTGSHCLRSPDCCEKSVEANERCYRFQAHRTALALAETLSLGARKEGWSLSFQSRMGRTPWIGPHTDEVVADLARRGIRRLTVICPSFVADCLETIEEIGMRAAGDFREAGGERLSLVPCVNSSPRWVEAIEAMITMEEAQG